MDPSLLYFHTILEIKKKKEKREQIPLPRFTVVFKGSIVRENNVRKSPFYLFSIPQSCIFYRTFFQYTMTVISISDIFCPSVILTLHIRVISNIGSLVSILMQSRTIVGGQGGMRLGRKFYEGPKKLIKMT